MDFVEDLAQAASGELTPLKQERALEDLMYQSKRKVHAEVICGVNYGFDKDGDFMIVLESGCKPDFKFLLCVRIKDKSDLTWAETRAMHVCLRLGERGNSLNSSLFSQWLEALRKEYPNVSTQDTNQACAIIINPKVVSRDHAHGRIKKCAFGFDSDGDVVVNFGTDSEQFGFIIAHHEIASSYSMIEQRALAEILRIAEPGDKMDESIFLQHCARLQVKYNVLKNFRSGSAVKAHIIPTTLGLGATGLRFASEIHLPAVITAETLDWSTATKARLAALGGSPVTPVDGAVADTDAAPLMALLA
jgi:hypothetical protein